MPHALGPGRAGRLCTDARSQQHNPQTASRARRTPPRARLTTSSPRRIPTYAPVKDDPNLPRVLLIGDSISEGYTVPVRRLLAGKANVHRIPVNGAFSANGLTHIKEWLGDGRWAVIHFNWGIWDMHHLGPNGEFVTQGGQIRTPIPQYVENLDKLIDAMNATGARLIWASTTPIAPGLCVHPESVAQYNAAAKKLMKRHHIRIDDLNAAITPRVDELRSPDGCHYTPAGSEVLAQKVARSILKELAMPVGASKMKAE